VFIIPRTKQQNEAMRQATNEKIIHAAIPLFSQKGVSATGVQEIADLAGISVGLLYRHYKTKEDIFRAVVQVAINGLKEMEAFFEGKPLETMNWWANDILNDIQNNNVFVHMLNVMSPANIANDKFPCKDEIIEAHLFFRQKFVDLIIRGQDEGVFRSGDPQAMALLFLIIIDGLSGMKLALKESFVVPTPQMLTAFIIME
jgi:TetR/AcrR family acrAB operon transcriptional repressor